jgi:hypothetical protein
VREIGIGLGREVGLAQGKQRGLDVETAILGVQAEYSRRRRLAQRVLAEGVLDGADALVGRQETLDVAARQEQCAGSGTRASARRAGERHARVIFRASTVLRRECERRPPVADASLEEAGRVSPERLPKGDVQIAAAEPDISEHVIVQIREAREVPAMFDACDEPPPASRQRRGAVADPRGQANRWEQLDKSVGSFRDIELHAGLPLVRASGLSTSRPW